MPKHAAAPVGRPRKTAPFASSMLAAVAIASLSAGGRANAQAAPGFGPNAFPLISNQMASARIEANRTADVARQIRALRDLQARQAAQPQRFELAVGGQNGVRFEAPPAAGLSAGLAPPAVNYTFNIQNGDGNTASNRSTTHTLRHTTTIAAQGDYPSPSVDAQAPNATAQPVTEGDDDPAAAPADGAAFRAKAPAAPSPARMR